MLFQWAIGIPTHFTAGGDYSLPVYERIARRSRVDCTSEWPVGGDLLPSRGADVTTMKIILFSTLLTASSRE